MSTLPGPRPPGLDGPSGGNDPRRLLITMTVLMGAVMLMQYFNPPKRSKAPVETPAPVVAPAANTGTPAAPDPAQQPGTIIPGTPAEAAAQDDPPQPESLVALGKAPLLLKVSTLGGRVVEAVLPGYVEHRVLAGEKEHPVDVSGEKGPQGGALAFTLPGLAADASFRVTSQTATEAVLERTGGGLHVVRRYKVHGDHGLLQETELTNTGTGPRQVEPVVSFTRRIHPEEHNSGSLLSGGAPTDQTGFLCETPEKLMREIAPNLKEPVKLAGKVTWAGIDRQYFLAGAVLRKGDAVRCEGTVAADLARLNVSYAPVTLQPGASTTFTLDTYFGPKQEVLLLAADPLLANAVDYGWFGVLVRLLLKLLVWFHSVIPNYGVAVLLLTLSVKLLTLPLTQRSFISQQKMKDLGPKLKEIQAKYAHDKAMQGQKQMEMFKAEGVSPLGGCIPMLVQMPVWIALYRTLYTSVELYQQPFINGWIADLTQKDPYYVMPIALGIVMLIQAFLTPTPQDQPQMKYVQYGMPIFFTTIMVSLPSGLTLYMLFNAVLTILQQLYIKRRFGKPEPKAV
jgi:YidC/Oxa1 family membrane protein insertase